MMMSGRREKRRALKFGVRTRLIPHLHALGFEKVGAKANRARWPEEPVGGFAFGRVRGTTADLLDVYWDKYGAPKFAIHFASRPKAEELASGEIPRLESRFYGLPWGLLGFGGVWFGPGQSAESAVDLAIQRISEWDEALRTEDVRLLTALQTSWDLRRADSLPRTGPASWWLRHVRTDVPRAIGAFYDWMWRITGSSPR